MWTFTWPTVVDIIVVRNAWNHFLNSGSGLLRSSPLVSGLRVFEVHPGEDGEHSHGLHIHFVVNQRLPVDIVRIIAQRAGFGRIHVKRVKERKHALYLSKYLRKQDRTEALIGCRLWAEFGHEKGARWRISRYTANDGGARMYSGRYRLEGEKKITQVELGCSNRQVAEKKFGKSLRRKNERPPASLRQRINARRQEHLLPSHLDEMIASKARGNDGHCLGNMKGPHHPLSQPVTINGAHGSSAWK